MSSRIGVPPREIFDLHPDQWTEPFWKATVEHRLVIPRCKSCGTFRMPPGPVCHECQSMELDYVEVSGKGSVYSFTVIRRAMIPALKESIPYIVAVVELPDAGEVRLVTNMIDVDPDEVQIGMPVEVVWDDLDEEVTVPRFRPASR